jgi:recyclin-1
VRAKQWRWRWRWRPRHVDGLTICRAQNQMSTYKPAEHEETMSVAPLLQFFELVHIGDTIQSMVQVYFDKDLTPYVDKTDFLNAVMREKKRFEAVLDDAVAAGLNAGIEVLMNQVSGGVATSNV